MAWFIVGYWIFWITLLSWSYQENKELRRLHQLPPGNRAK